MSDDPEPVSDGAAASASLLSGAAHAPYGDLLGSPATAAPPYVPSPPHTQAAMARVPATQDPYFSFQQLPAGGVGQPPGGAAAAKRGPASQDPAVQDPYFSFQQLPAGGAGQPPPHAPAAKRGPATQAYFVGYGSYQQASSPDTRYQQSPYYAEGKSSPYSARPVRAATRDDACDECIGCCLTALCQAICAALCDPALNSRN